MQFIDGNLIINNELIFTEILKKNDYVFCSQKLNVRTYQENINNKKYNVTYSIKNSFDNSDLYIVPKDHYFFLGDNRDCSKDSRFLSDVVYVHKDNLVGKAQISFFFF